MDARIPTEAVEGLMKKVFVEHSGDPGLFWDALLKANLYIPISSKEGVTLKESEDSEEIPILLGTDSEGVEVIWLFTSPQIMKEYIEEDLPYKEISAAKIFSLLEESEHGVVLIGPQKLTLSLHKDLVTSLGDGKVPEVPGGVDIQTVSTDMQVYVGLPTEDTSALETKFKELFAHTSDVLEAAFIQVADEMNGSRLLLGLKLKQESKEDFQRVAGLVASAVQGLLPQGKTMDVTLINRSMKGAFEKWGKPFFKR